MKKHNLQKYKDKKIDVVEIDDKMTKIAVEQLLLHARNMLNENGIVHTNIIGSIEGEDSDFIEYEYATYRTVFDDVKIFMVDNKDRTNRQNLILVGIKGNPQIDETKTTEYSEYLDMEMVEFETDKNIVTDDFAPIGN